MMVVPVTRPVTIPDVEPTVANIVLLLLQVPLPASLNVVVAPGQTFSAPEIVFGDGFTVTIAVLLLLLHPVGKVYTIVVVPANKPVTIPDEDPMDAVVGMLLVHVPLPASLRVVVALMHTPRLPLIAVGTGLTVTTAIFLQPVDKV